MADENEVLEFTSSLGDQPWFFAPDTGTEGGTAYLTGPMGDSQRKNVTQVRAVGSDDGPFGRRIGFRVPEPWTVEGDYKLHIDQDGHKTTYLIHVTEHPDVAAVRALRERLAKAEQRAAQSLDAQVRARALEAANG